MVTADSDSEKIISNAPVLTPRTGAFDVFASESPEWPLSAPARSVDDGLMKAPWSDRIPRPRDSVESNWMKHPDVLATAEESKEARREWLKVAPSMRGFMRELAPHQSAALERMHEAHAAHRAAKEAALAHVVASLV